MYVHSTLCRTAHYTCNKIRVTTALSTSAGLMRAARHVFQIPEAEVIARLIVIGLAVSVLWVAVSPGSCCCLPPSAVDSLCCDVM